MKGKIFNILIYSEIKFWVYVNESGNFFYKRFMGGF